MTQMSNLLCSLLKYTKVSALIIMVVCIIICQMGVICFDFSLVHIVNLYCVLFSSMLGFLHCASLILDIF